MTPPTVEQLRMWRRRLMQLAAEMEASYGPPGEQNQDALDAAVHVALYIACDKAELAEKRERSSVA